MAFIQKLGQLRSPVSVYTNLPLADNVLGDVRLSTDTGDAYVWIISSPTGALTDWNKVTNSSYNALLGSPTSSALAIDNAVTVIKSLVINMSLIAFNTMTAYYSAIGKMFDGFVHQMVATPYDNDPGLEIGLCENQIHIFPIDGQYEPYQMPYYMPNKGDFDINTKLLIHGDGIQGSTSFVDLLRNPLTINGACVDISTKKFGTGSIKFDGVNDYVILSPEMPFWNYFSQSLFCIDFWLNSATGEQYILSNAANSLSFPTITEGEGFSISKNASNKLVVVTMYELGIAPYSSIISVTSTSSISSNTWNHIAIQRNSTGYVEIWINGVLDATSATNSLSTLTSNRKLYLGKQSSSYLNGYIDELRISFIPRYTTTFTPMTKAYNTATTPAPTPTIVDASAGNKTVTVFGDARMSGNDLSFGNASLYLDGINSYLSLADSDDWYMDAAGSIDAYTKLLLHLDNNVTDSETTPKTVTNNGVAFVSPKFGTSLASFNGTSSYLSVPNSTDFQFGTGDFTMDFWVNLSSLPTSGNLFDFIAKNLVDPTWRFFIINSSGVYTIRFGGGGGPYVISSSVTVNLNTWYHIALVRNGTNLRLYQNGVMIGELTSSLAIPTNTGAIQIGVTLNGYMDEVRISKGIARWTSNFTPETSAYTNDSYTKLLLHLDGNVVDSEGTPKTVTNNGVTFIAPKFGTSLASFNGTSSYLTVPDSDDFYFGSGDFTIDFWVNFAVDLTANNSIIFDQNPISTERFYFGFYKDAGVYCTTLAIKIANSWVLTSNRSMTSISTGVWYHFALIRNGNNINIYKNGVATGSNISYSGEIPNIPSVLKIGSTGTSWFLNGYLDEYRISKGIARWTSNFTPPTLPYGAAALADYTVDLWVDPLSLTDLNTYIIGQDDSWKLTLDGSANKYLKYQIVGGASVIATTTLQTNTWTHIAIVQSSGVIKIYVNGVMSASLAGTTMVNGTQPLTIGATHTGANMFNGYIEEVRVSKGIARWTTDFSVPESEYSADSYTKLLLPLNVQVVPNMVLQSVGYVANYVPTSARVVIFEEDIDVMEPNVDLIIEVSRDGGTTFSNCVLAKDMEFGDDTLNLFTGSVDLNDQPNGELMVWRLVTQNNKDCRIRGISLNWR